MALEKQIAKAVEWLNEPNEFLESASFTANSRVRVSVGLLNLSLEHQGGIIALVDHQIFGSALALIRPQFEAYVRGIWYSKCASDDQVEHFLKGADPPKIRTLIELVEKYEGNNNNALSKLKAKVWPMLNDYTHGGARQVAARNSEEHIEHNYNPVHIAGAVQSSVGLAFSASVEIAKIAENPELANKLLDLRKRIYE